MTHDVSELFLFSQLTSPFCKVGRVDAAKASGAYIPGMAPPDANKPSKNARKQVQLYWPGRFVGVRQLLVIVVYCTVCGSGCRNSGGQKG